MLKPIVALLTSTLAVALIGAAQTVPNAMPTPIPLATPMPPPTPMPIVTPSATPSPSPKPTTSPASIVTPMPLPTPLVLPPDAPPQILAIRMDNPVLHGGDMVGGTVVTSTNVASVEVRLGPRSMSIPRTAVGDISNELSDAARAVLHSADNYTAAVIARNAAGISAERDVNVSVR